MRPVNITLNITFTPPIIHTGHNWIYAHQWTSYLLFNVHCPQGSLLSLRHQAMNRWTVNCPYCSMLSAPGAECTLSMCPRGTQHHQLDIKLFKAEWPREESTVIVPQGSSLSPISYKILSRGHCLMLSSPESTLIIPKGNLVSALGSEVLAKYCHQVQRSYSIVQCWVPLGHCHCASRELVITGWLCIIITSGPGHCLMQLSCWVPTGKTIVIVPQGNSVSPLGTEEWKAKSA